ncbi:MAG: TetR family transcriptional regulator [Nitrospinae bacterium]|nr:TetR family transcriptional regulator [Nitrospinota bacterium]
MTPNRRPVYYGRMEELSTKEILLRAGKSLFIEKGYHHTGLQEIVKSAGVPKGSFYHFFDSKEAFGIAVLEHHMKSFQPFIEKPLLEDKTTPPLKRLRNFFLSGCSQLASEGYQGGCIVGNFSQEMADQNETCRAFLESAMQTWENLFIECLREAQSMGHISSREDVIELGHFLMNGWEGAILRMKLTRSRKPLQNFLDLVFNKILVTGD